MRKKTVPIHKRTHKHMCHQVKVGINVSSFCFACFSVCVSCPVECVYFESEKKPPNCANKHSMHVIHVKWQTIPISPLLCSLISFPKYSTKKIPPSSLRFHACFFRVGFFICPWHMFFDRNFGVAIAFAVLLLLSLSLSLSKSFQSKWNFMKTEWGKKRVASNIPTASYTWIPFFFVELPVLLIYNHSLNSGDCDKLFTIRSNAKSYNKTVNTFDKVETKDVKQLAPPPSSPWIAQITSSSKRGF